MQAVAMEAAKAKMTMMKSTMLYQDFLLKNNFGVKAITRQNTCCKIIKTNSALDLQTSKRKYMERANSRLRMITTVGLPAQLKATSTMMKEMSRVMSRRVINRNQMFSTVLLSFQCKYFLLQPLEKRDENHFHLFFSQWAHLIGGLAGSGACWSDMMSPAPHLNSISPLSLRWEKFSFIIKQQSTCLQWRGQGWQCAPTSDSEGWGRSEQLSLLCASKSSKSPLGTFSAGAPVGELCVNEKMFTNKYFVETIIFEFSSSSSMLATTPNGGWQLKRCRLCGCRHN